MAPESVQELPDGERVNVIDPETAAQYLARLVRNYGAGFDQAMVIGDDRPLGVVIPYEHWLQYLALYEAAQADDRSVRSDKSFPMRAEKTARHLPWRRPSLVAPSRCRSTP